MTQSISLSIPELDALVNEDFKKFFLDFSEGYKGSHIYHKTFLSIHSGAKAYNALYTTTDIQGADESIISKDIEEATSFFDERDSTFTAYIADSDIGPEKKRICKYFDDNGWYEKPALVNMGLDMENYETQILDMPDNFEIVEVANDIELEEFCQIVPAEFLCHPYEAPHVDDVAKGMQLLNRAHWFMYVAKLNGEIVGTIALAKNHVDKPYVGSLHMVVVKKEFRRRGFGSLMMKFILNLSKDREVRYCLLQAEPDGVNLYKSYGFEVYGRIYVYLPPVSNTF